MAEDRPKDPFMAISTVVILLAALGITFFQPEPLKSPRPPSTIREPAAAEQVQARLWQDPLTAVLEQIQSRPQKSEGSAKIPGPCRLTSHRRELRLADCDPATVRENPLLQAIAALLRPDQHLTILGVMVPGSPYAEDIESRIRQRVAVLSALGRLGYVPEEAEHLHFERIQLSDLPASEQFRLSEILPYEWLERKSERHADKVLLLWLNSDNFQNRPLNGLKVLTKYLLGAPDPAPPADPALGQPTKPHANLNLTVIGPDSSGLLSKMVQEMLADPGRQLQFPHNLKLFSSSATVPQAHLLGLEDFPLDRCLDQAKAGELQHRVRSLFKDKAGLDVQLDFDSGERIDDQLGRAIWSLFQQRRIAFSRTITTDAKLAELLLAELLNRGIFRPGNNDNLVLISEWDTLYGRTLPEIFHQVLRQRADTCPVGGVYKYSYLRGLDGLAPGSKENKEARSRAGSSKEDLEKERLAQEDPVGPIQYDYLRRLADKVYQRHQGLGEQQRGPIRAVGILGNDFYDKYLVLQALKQRLPEAIYFTTDLDARYLHESYNKEARNLVVASGFDLQLPEKVQGDVPPFRSSYQTSVFYAVLKACGREEDANRQDPELATFCGKVKDLEANRPQVFEIGRQHAVNLSRAAPINSPLSLGKFLLILFLGFLVLRIMSPALLNWFASRTHQIYFLCILIGFAACYIFLRTIILPDAREEPFSLFEGVSVWPTEIIRLLALAATWLFIINVRQSLRQSNEALRAEFDLPVGRKRLCWQGVLRPFFQDIPKNLLNFKGFWQLLDRLLPSEPAKTGEKIDIKEFWQGYQDKKVCQGLRVLFGVLFYFLLTSVLIRTFGRPFPPVRGHWSSWADFVILFATIISFLFLTFYVFDCTRLLRWFIINVAGKQHLWSQGSVKRFLGDAEAPVAEIQCWMTVCLVARRTAVVNKFIYYPFIVWLILFLSRQPYFDNWTVPVILGVVISLSAVITWICALMLNRAAEKLRLQTLQQLAKTVLTLKAQLPPAESSLKTVERVMDEVKNIREGAFTPFFKNPVVQALFVPFGGVGGLTLLEYLSRLS